MANADVKKKEREYALFVAQKVKEFNENGKMTVAIFGDAFFPCVDGVVMVEDNVAKRLKDRCNIVVFAPKHKGVTFKADYLVVGCASIYLKGLNYDTASFFNLGKLYRDTVKNLRIDVIHAHSPFKLGLTALKLHKKKKLPFVMTFHSQYKQDIYKETHSRLLTAIGMKIVMKSFNGADEVWTMHKKSAETLISYGYKGVINFMPNATDFVYPADADQRIARIREKYHIKDGHKLFIFVGRLVTQKNILFIAEVLGRLKKRGLEFTMVYIGDGPDKKKLEDKIAAEDLTKRCVFTGKVEDKDCLKDYYLAADMLLFPSKYDVSSIIQIEAAAMKTPCAFIEDSVTSCTITGGLNGLILPDDVDKFADGVFGLVTDEERLKKMSEKAYEQIYVTWDQVVDSTYRNYLRLAKRDE